MLKRILSFVTAVSLLLSAQSFAWAADVEEEESYKGFEYEHKIESTEPEFMLDFENLSMSTSGSSGFTGESGASPYPKDGVGEGMAFNVTASAQPYIQLGEKLTQGTYLFSFDVRREKPNSWIYVRLNADGSFFDTFGLLGEKAGYNNNWSIQGGITAKAEEWHHINMYLDFDNSRIHYYVDNQYSYESAKLPDLSRITFMIEGNSDQVTSLDNVTLFKFTPELRREIEALGMEMPTSFKGDLSLDIKTKYDGNAFTEFDDVAVDVLVGNKLKTEMEYDIDYVVKKYDGDIVWTGKEENIKIDGSETKTHTIKPKVSLYDIYTVYVTVSPHGEGLDVITDDREFSVVHTCTYGYKSDYVGCHTHPGRWTDWNKVKRLVDIAGIGYLRTDASWGGNEKAKGVYKFSNEAENNYPGYSQQLADMGIVSLTEFGPTNSLYNVGSITAWQNLDDWTEAEAALEKAAEEFTKMSDFGGKEQVIELGNEYNFARIENASPETTAKVDAIAYRGIKKANPDAIVLTNGISRNAADWVYRYLTATEEPTCDAVAIHMYGEAGSNESKQFDKYVNEVKEAMTRAGYPDMDLWQTEGGCSAFKAYATEKEWGVWITRSFAYNQAYDLLDKFMFYQLQTAASNPNDQEGYFGCLQGMNEKNANAPKQGYLAIANFIAMTENAKVDKTLNDGSTTVFRYKKEDGGNMLMMYADRDTTITTLDLGASSGTMYDINGNPTKLNSVDGKFTFTLYDEPIYFEYDGKDPEICANVISSNKYIMNPSLGSSDSFKLTVPDGATVKAEGCDKLDIKVVQNGNSAEIGVTALKLPEIVEKPAIGNVANVDYTERIHDFGTQRYRDYIDVEVIQSGVRTALLKLPVDYKLSPVDIRMRVKPYDNTNTKYWVGVITVKNNTDKPMSGTLKVTLPEEMNEIRIENLQPGVTKEVQYNIPPKYSEGYHQHGGIFSIDGGETLNYYMGDVPDSYHYNNPSGTVSFGTIEKVKGDAPVIDGIIDETEWKDYKITDFDKSAVTFGSQGIINAGVVEAESFGADADYGGMADFSGTIYAQWDDKFLYTAAIVYDDVHWQKQDPVRFYYDDHFYLTAGASTTQRHDTRIEMALSDFFEDERYTDEDRTGKLYRNWSQMFDVPVGGVIPQSEDGNQVKIIRKNNATIYEARILLTELYSPEILAVKPIQQQLAFNIRDYDGDRDKTFGWGGWFVLVDTKK